MANANKIGLFIRISTCQIGRCGQQSTQARQTFGSEGGEVLVVAARFEITDHTTPTRTARAPAMLVHSSLVK
jgi:hypothetical protein